MAGDSYDPANNSWSLCRDLYNEKGLGGWPPPDLESQLSTNQGKANFWLWGGKVPGSLHGKASRLFQGKSAK